MTSKVKPIPEGHHTATPYLIIKDAADAIEHWIEHGGTDTMSRFNKGDVGLL